MIERIDIYDAQKQPTGRTRARGEALLPGEYKLAVGIWIINPRGEVLLTLRAPTKSFAPNKWENTGGHVRAGETAEAAVLRELAEETGIKVTPDALRYLGCATVPPYFGANWAAFLDIPLEAIRLEPSETVDARWASADELARMIDSGEMAPSVADHLAHYRPALERAMADAAKKEA